MFQSSTFHFATPHFFRHGFQGSEEDDEVKGDGSSYTTFFRQLDPRLGRWLSIDPKKTAWESPYASMGNNPILQNDPLGDTIRLFTSGNALHKMAEELLALMVLQRLTNDELTLKDGVILIKSKGTANDGKDLPTGTALVRELIEHKKDLVLGQNTDDENKTSWRAGEDIADRSNGKGVNAEVTVDLTHKSKYLTENGETKKSEWAYGPVEIALAHELGHGLGYMNGTRAKENSRASYTYKDENGVKWKMTQDKEEVENVGLSGDRKITENKIRKEQGLRKRVKY